MNEQWGGAALDEPQRSIDFDGRWQEFLPVALTNLLLTLVTLGIYRFWAKARERRYLWSRTHVLGDRLEWTGTGLEMLIGFVIVMAVLLPIVLILNTGLEAMALRGMWAEAASIGFGLYGLLLYLYHVARFRSLRYRLSRTYWRGIRGGTDHSGWAYGWSGLWKTGASWAVMGLLTPWATVQLWNERWSKMSFGSLPFVARVQEDGLMRRWLLVYLAPIVGVLLLIVLGVAGAFFDTASPAAEPAPDALFLAIFGAIALFYTVFLFASLNFYALFYRRAAEGTSLAGARFTFTAGTKDWLKLILGHFGLVIITLGVGLLFIGYRNWSFMVRHLETSGGFDFEQLTQSETRSPGDAEGLADAFDFGAV